MNLTVIQPSRHSYESPITHDVCVAPNFDFATTEEAAEWLFDRTNNPKFDGQPRLWKGRCLSVGDMVVGLGQVAICQSVGWKVINAERA